jgi:hypothetical protein
MFVNTTPHPIVLYSEDGFEVLNIPKAVAAARCRETERTSLPGYPFPAFSAPIMGPAIDIPEYYHGEHIGKFLVVSMLVGQALAKNRLGWPEGFVVGPDTSPTGAVRDDKGQIIGTNAFVVYA